MSQMTGIVLASPATRANFRDAFDGTALRVEWRETPHGPSAPADFVLDLDFEPDRGRIAALSAFQTPLVLINDVSTPLHTLDADDRFARINGWNTFLQRPLAELVAPPASRETATAWCTAAGKTPEWLEDVPGMPSARIVSMIINEAYLALEEGVSTREAIDTAMRLGTNYPLGPFEWAASIGLKPVCRLLEILTRENPLYSIAPLLKKEAHGPAA